MTEVDSISYKASNVAKSFFSFVKPKHILIMKLLMSTFDCVTDFVLLGGIVGPSYGRGGALFPCRFGPSDFSHSRNCGETYSNQCYFNNMGGRAFYSNFDRYCKPDSRADGNCDCPGFMSSGDVSDSRDSISTVATVFLIMLAVKEGLKALIMVFFFCLPKLHSPKYVKYALNSPFTLCVLWAPAVYDMAIESTVAIMEGNEEPWHIVLDVILEDIPGLVIPCWYIDHGTTTPIAIASLVATLLAIAANLYWIYRGINWSRQMSFVSNMLRANAGFNEKNNVSEGGSTGNEMIVPSTTTRSDIVYSDIECRINERVDLLISELRTELRTIQEALEMK